MDTNHDEQPAVKKEKLLPAPYDSTLVMGAEIDIAEHRYRCKGGSLQMGFADRANLYVFTYGRSAEEELNENLLKSRNRLGLLGVNLLFDSNGVILYDGGKGRPIRTFMDYSAGGENNFNNENKIIRLKHVRYPEFRYSAEPLTMSHLTHPEVEMAPETLIAIEELTGTGRVTIHNLTILSNAVKTVSKQFDPEKKWTYNDLWVLLKDKIKHDLESFFIGDTEEMKKARIKMLNDQLEWMNDMEGFAGLSDKEELPM